MTKIKWQAVFFDCDGVILDSVKVKTMAFAKMFHPYGPDVESAVVKYHLENGGVSRFEKFRYYYQNILGLSITNDEIHKLSVVFSKMVVEKVIASPYIEGALETLEMLKKNEVDLYLISGTPESEIIEIAKRKKIVRFFIEIHGSPAKKWDIVADIIARKGYTLDKCLFIGDAMSDYEAAVKNYIHFIGIVLSGEKSVFPTGTRLMSKISL